MRTDVRYSANMTVMTRAVEAAAKGLIRDFGELEKLQVSKKSLGDFVSTADLRSEKILIEHLQKARAGYTILSEEAGLIEGTEPFRFIIDPLDGTSNFLHAIPHWSISVALEETTEKGSEIIAGVIYDPIKDEMFWAEKGKGAFMNNFRLRVSGRRKMNETVISCGVPALKPEADRKRFLREMDILMQQVAGMRRFASGCLDLCYVAAGRVDGFFERGLKEWDMAAGSLIIREAGGMVSDFDNRDEFLNKHEIIAGNRDVHPMLVKFLQQARDA